MQPNTPATFYAFDDSLISIPLITLSAYVIALRSVVKHQFDPTPAQDIESKARTMLHTPDDYPVEHILEHLETVRTQTHKHYGIE